MFYVISLYPISTNTLPNKHIEIEDIYVFQLSNGKQRLNR